LLRLARPRQWTKNAIVLAALVFAGGDPSQALEGGAWIRALAAAALFCLISSGVYALNDAQDVREDRRHPDKRNRPVAAGEVSASAARVWGGLWILAGLGGAVALDLRFAGVATAYVLLQTGYTFALKRIPLIDVFVIAFGFVLRAMAGAVVLPVRISPWLLLCTLVLALFLALCKRRCEKQRNPEGNGGESSRESLDHYDRRLLDQLIAVTGSATVICYALYTQWPDTVAKFGTTRLGLTIPFVLFGCFRHLYLVYRGGQGERPEQLLLTDTPLLVTIGLYVATLLVVFMSAALH
jgi:4-hydroxybenzoate polyprenyltransferase